MFFYKAVTQCSMTVTVILYKAEILLRHTNHDWTGTQIMTDNSIYFLLGKAEILMLS